jgi:HrpA-like RNA helicase
MTIVAASTGSGKSTRIPPQLVRVLQHRVVVTSPTIAATRSLYKRVSNAERDLRIGCAAGGVVKYDARTNIAFVTAGHLKNVLLREGNLGLLRGATMMLDESHTVSVDYEIMNTLLKEFSSTIDKMLISSATLDTDATAEQWNTIDSKPAIVDITVPTYTIDEVYETRPIPESELAATVIKTLIDYNTTLPAGHFLVFLPGEKQITAVYDALMASDATNLYVYAAYSSLPYTEIDEAFTQVVPAPDDKRRSVILATDIAETSVTIPGVILVVDSGLQRLVTSHTPTSSTLITTQASQFSRVQRRGRTGRTGDGLVHYLFTSDQATRAPRHYPCELSRTPLHTPVLQFLAHGRSPSILAKWVDTVSEDSIDDTVDYLLEHDYVESKSGEEQPTLTALGKYVMKLPIDIDFARLCYQFVGNRALVESCTPFDKLVFAVLVAVVQVESSGSGLAYIPRRKRTQDRNEYNDFVNEYQDKYVQFQQDSSSPIHTSVNVVLACMMKTKSTRPDKRTCAFAVKNGLNNKSLSNVLKTVHKIVSIVFDRRDAVQVTRSVLDITDVDTLTKQTADFLERDGVMSTIKESGETFVVDDRGSWWKEADTDRSGTFYRLSNKGIGPSDAFDNRKQVTALHLYHVTGNGRQTLGFISLAL